MSGKSKFVLLVLLCTAIMAGCTSAASPTLSPTTNNDSASNSTAAANSSNKLNLNTANGSELQAVIPNLGNRMVREFQEYRPYISIQQFRKEIGKYVDEAQVTEYEKYVYVPISFNDSDSETLQQIPGVDASEAEALIAARPYPSLENFTNSLGQYISADELEIAKTYLGEN